MARVLVVTAVPVPGVVVVTTIHLVGALAVVVGASSSVVGLPAVLMDIELFTGNGGVRFGRRVGHGKNLRDIPYRGILWPAIEVRT